MKQMQLREAKAGLSAVIDLAEKGESTVITRHGRPAAVVVSHDEWKRLTGKLPSFSQLLLAVPAIDETDLPVRGKARIARDPFSTGQNN